MTPAEAAVFKRLGAGRLLIELGYEKDESWEPDSEAA
jgi:hypothetical protein